MSGLQWLARCFNGLEGRYHCPFPSLVSYYSTCCRSHFLALKTCVSGLQQLARCFNGLEGRYHCPFPSLISYYSAWCHLHFFGIQDMCEWSTAIGSETAMWASMTITVNTDHREPCVNLWIIRDTVSEKQVWKALAMKQKQCCECKAKTLGWAKRPNTIRIF